MDVVEMLRAPTEEDLARRARAGDRAAAALLVERLYPGVHTVCLRMLRSADDARDAAQETFARVLANLDQLRPDHRVGPWVLKIAVNLMRDLLRRRGRAPLSELEPDEWPSAAPLPPECATREEDAARLRAELLALPEGMRLALLLHFQEGLDGREVAFVMGITHDAARLKICRGLAKLRACMKETP